MTSDVEYSCQERELQSGDTVVFYTDGIIEAENKAGEMYDTERLEQIMKRMNSTMSSEKVIEAILQDVSDFAGSSEQYDDMTVVVVKKL